MTSRNTELERGEFRDLSIVSLRPPRGLDDKPQTGLTHDGALRGLVVLPKGSRHIDVTARFGMGAHVRVQTLERPTDMQRIAPLHRLGPQLQGRVQGVRAVRLHALLGERDGAPWSPPGVSTEEAIAAWDWLLEGLFMRVPLAYRMHQNPWMWWHLLEPSP